MKLLDWASSCATWTGKALGPAMAVVIILGVAAPATAYVVVTSDNQVYEVPARPEVRGDMVYFMLDGIPVSMRMYDLNIAKTNQFNYALDSGGDPMAVAREARRLPPALPDDRRLILSHELRLKRFTDLEPTAPDFRLMNDGQGNEKTSFGDSVGPNMPPSTRTTWPRGERTSFGDEPGRPSAVGDETSRSRFADEARRAYEAAENESYQPQPSSMAEPQLRSRGPDSRLAAIDSEIEGEQAYLRRLTSGEEPVNDLDGEIDRSMEKIRKLQRRRNDMSNDMPEAAPEPSGYRPAAAYEASGRFPRGSRSAKTEQALSELRERKSFYEKQQAELPPGSTRDREILDERLGELDYRIAKLEKKLAKAARQ